jgi:hypothetical protein
MLSNAVLGSENELPPIDDLNFSRWKCWITALVYLLPPAASPVYPIAAAADAGSLCPFYSAGILYTQSRHPYGSSCIGYTVAVPSATAKSLFLFSLILVCNFLLLIDDRWLFLSSSLFFDRLLVNEELKWAALQARSGRYFWAIDIRQSAQLNFSALFLFNYLSQPSCFFV